MSTDDRGSEIIIPDRARLSTSHTPLPAELLRLEREETKSTGGVYVDGQQLVIPKSRNKKPVTLEDAARFLNTDAGKRIVPKEDIGATLAKGELTLLYSMPWKFTEKIALENGWTAATELTKILELSEGSLAPVNRIGALLRSGVPQNIETALAEIRTFPEEQQKHWLSWMSSLRHGQRSVSGKLVLNFLEEKQNEGITPSAISVTDAFLKTHLKPKGAVDAEGAAEQWNDSGSREQLFSHGHQKVDMGERGGVVERQDPSLFDNFSVDLLNKVAEGSQTVAEWNNWMHRYNEIVETLRYKYEMFKIDSPLTVECIVKNMFDARIGHPNADTTPTWDLLSRFEIPHVLAGDILTLMDRHHNLDHPLAYQLMSYLPENHPFFKTQAARVEELKSLCEGSPQTVMANWDKMKIFKGRLVSIYPKGIPEQLAGFDLEMTPYIAGIPLPTGVQMGQDSGTSSLNEIRLIRQPDILRYDDKWRARIFDLWLWSKTAKTVSSSVHLHIDRDSDIPHAIKEDGLMGILFGTDTDDYRYNPISVGRVGNETKYKYTHEVRTALAGYSARSEGVGFTEGFQFVPLLDFMMAAKFHVDDVLVNNAVMEDLDSAQQRLLSVLNVCPNAELRAAAVRVLMSHFEKRIVPLDVKEIDRLATIKYLKPPSQRPSEPEPQPEPEPFDKKKKQSDKTRSRSFEQDQYDRYQFREENYSRPTFQEEYIETAEKIVELPQLSSETLIAELDPLIKKYNASTSNSYEKMETGLAIRNAIPKKVTQAEWIRAVEPAIMHILHTTREKQGSYSLDLSSMLLDRLLDQNVSGDIMLPLVRDVMTHTMMDSYSSLPIKSKLKHLMKEKAHRPAYNTRIVERVKDFAIYKQHSLTREQIVDLFLDITTNIARSTEPKRMSMRKLIGDITDIGFLRPKDFLDIYRTALEATAKNGNYNTEVVVSVINNAAYKGVRDDVDAVAELLKDIQPKVPAGFFHALCVLPFFEQNGGLRIMYSPDELSQLFIHMYEITGGIDDRVNEKLVEAIDKVDRRDYGSNAIINACEQLIEISRGTRHHALTLERMLRERKKIIEVGPPGEFAKRFYFNLNAEIKQMIAGKTSTISELSLLTNRITSSIGEMFASPQLREHTYHYALDLLHSVEGEGSVYDNVLEELVGNIGTYPIDNIEDRRKLISEIEARAQGRGESFEVVESNIIRNVKAVQLPPSENAAFVMRRLKRLEGMQVKHFNHYIEDALGGLDAVSIPASDIKNEIIPLIKQHIYKKPMLGRLAIAATTFLSHHLEDPVIAKEFFQLSRDTLSGVTLPNTVVYDKRYSSHIAEILSTARYHSARDEGEAVKILGGIMLRSHPEFWSFYGNALLENLLVSRFDPFSKSMLVQMCFKELSLINLNYTARLLISGLSRAKLTEKQMGELVTFIEQSGVLDDPAYYNEFMNYIPRYQLDPQFKKELWKRMITRFDGVDSTSKILRVQDANVGWYRVQKT